MKMRDDDVVSASVRLMHESAVQGRASAESMCANSDAMLRSLLVSSLWMMAYCSWNMPSYRSYGGGGTGGRESRNQGFQISFRNRTFALEQVLRGGNGRTNGVSAKARRMLSFTETDEP